MAALHERIIKKKDAAERDLSRPFQIYAVFRRLFKPGHPVQLAKRSGPIFAKSVIKCFAHILIILGKQENNGS